jgi:hypothetical protein
MSTRPPRIGGAAYGSHDPCPVQTRPGTRVMPNPVLRALGWQARVVAALIDAFETCDTIKEAAEHRLVKTAFVVETREPDGWNFSKSERLMRQRGWKTTQAIYESADIKPNHWPVLDLHTRGYGNREIANHVGLPLKTVWQWLDRDLDRLRRLDLGDLN